MHATGSSKPLIERLGRKAFRDAYVAEHLRTWIAYQVNVIREQRGWSQAELAKRTGKPQSVISRLENPDYGRFTVKTLLELASAFDVALLVKFVPFSALVGGNRDLSASAMQVAEFACDKGFDRDKGPSTPSASSADTKIIPLRPPTSSTGAALKPASPPMLTQSAGSADRVEWVPPITNARTS